MNLLQTIKKYPKDFMKVLLVVLIGFFAVMGWHFSDVANKPFWWKFWPILSVVCIIAWIVGWVLLKNQEKNK